MNYRTLSRYCNKISEDYLHENIVIPTIQVGYAKNKQNLVIINFNYTSTNIDEIMLFRRVFAKSLAEKSVALPRQAEY